MPWSYYAPTGEIVSPLIYDHGKTQETVVNEALEALDDSDIIFIQGGVGTGKSVIALHLIAHYKKGIIAVPTKNLEDQYVQDYCGAGKNTVHTLRGEPLNVNNLRGRTNFTCPNPPQDAVKPVDCGNRSLLCTRKLEKDEARAAVALECPHWSPIYSAGMTPPKVEQTRQLYAYESVGGPRYYCEAENPCPYYQQFRHYIPRGAIIMNVAKWEAETWLQRKPRVTVEIIDEADTFLDGLSYRVTVNQRLLDALKRENLINEQEHT
ncbi:MAG: DEAD/DEAH box helicase family protein, partial [Candidatus Bathyarchaeota archaeon]